MRKWIALPSADVALALAVAAIVGAMIVPLPPWLLDALLAVNLGLGLTLLIVALYAKDALTVASFPTLLLITTLFRLALNVSSTRLALLEAHAGEVIQAFGEFVIQGEYVVGAVVFCILTLVQFLVVAKGAERVAEVGARFTLDAMPGKQMAIDADLRAGAIDQDQARQRRRSLERESQLYGAMDGAMKFVKGDAIAGLLVVLINALGGLLVGVLAKGMTAAEAARTYTLLAIGDGLVSQIPALCIAVSAGLVVTRVAGDREQSTLGSDIGAQFVSHPKVLAIVGGLLALVGLVPMMPKIPFFGLAAAAALGARALARRARSPAAAAPAPRTGPGDPARAAPQIGTSPIVLDLDPSLQPLARGGGPPTLAEQLAALREQLFSELGVPLPAIHARLGGALGAGAYALQIDEVPCGRGAVEPDACYAVASAEEIAFLGIAATACEDAATGRRLARIAAADAPRLRAVGFQVRTASEQLLWHAAALLRRQAGTFLGVQEVQALLDGLEATHPALVRELAQRVPPALLADVLRRLVDEGVSIRNLRAVLEALVEPGAESDANVLAERCRRALRRHLTHRYAGEGALFAHLADPGLEQLLREAMACGAQAGGLALSPDDAAAILDGVRAALGGSAEGVILASADVRRPLRKLCEGTFPNVAVLTYAELVPDLQIRPMGKVSALRAEEDADQAV